MSKKDNISSSEFATKMIAMQRKLFKNHKAPKILYSELTVQTPIMIKGRHNGKYKTYIVKIVHTEKDYEDKYFRSRATAMLKLTDEQSKNFKVIKQVTIKLMGHGNKPKSKI